MSEPIDAYELPAAADFHVHLRDGPMMEAVTPTIQQGGVDTVFVMPNLVPPITTPTACQTYKSHLQRIDPSTAYLMSLYLHPSITPATVAEAKAAGIAGIKSYPAGVTTNSSSGVLSYEPFYPVFEAMQHHDMVLNLHGEVPPSPEVTVLNAEAAFLPTLLDLHAKFPRLRIVLEHCTTAAAVEAVRKCGPNVVGTITAHHLFLTVDDWAGDPINFCKPVAKLPADKLALVEAAFGPGNQGKFFFGSDSAPHLVGAKRAFAGGKCAAGVFTQPYVVGFVVEAYEEARRAGVDVGGQEALEGFLGRFGRKFYRVQESGRRIRVERPLGKNGIEGEVVRDVKVGGEVQAGVENKVITFRSGKPIWKVSWV